MARFAVYDKDGNLIEHIRADNLQDAIYKVRGAALAEEVADEAVDAQTYI